MFRAAPTFIGKARIITCVLRAISFATLTLAFVCSSLAQQAQQAEINKVLFEILNGENGYLDKGQYNRFWAMFPAELRTSQGKQAASNALRAMTLEAVDYQKVVYESALASAKARRVIRDPQVDELERRVVEAYRRTAGLASLPQFTNTPRFLEAAATGKSIVGPTGPVFVTQELIEKVLSNLQIMKVRLDRLVGPEFRTENVEQVYTDLGVRVILHEPLYIEVENLTFPGMSKESRYVTGTHNYGPSNTLIIGSMSVPITGTLNLESIRRVLIAGTERMAKSMGIQDGKIVFSIWRGKNSADFSGTMIIEKKAIGVVSKFVFDEQKNNLHQFLIMDTTIAEAGAVLSALLISTQLIQ